MNGRISAWEDEGGAVTRYPELSTRSLTGSESQVEWAERIRILVNDEFDRVAKSFRSVADTQSTGKRVRTEAILAILEEMRESVMSRKRGRLLHPGLAGHQRPGPADDRQRSEVPTTEGCKRPKRGLSESRQHEYPTPIRQAVSQAH